jgi:pimeloyl-ACP methyl ester carboxylesterase
MKFHYSRLSAIVKPALVELRKSRRPLQVPHSTFDVRSTDGVDLFCTRFGDEPGTAIIVAHAALGGSYYSYARSLAFELAGSFTVLAFDFRGHGRSSGRCPLGFQKPSEDLEALVDRAREMGFERIGVAGFSMGAAAGFMLAARRSCFDAFVSIGCPPQFPQMELWSRRPWLTRAFTRALGMRFDLAASGGEAPVDVAWRLPPIPKLLIFGEWEVATPEEISDFVAGVSIPKETITIPGVWHADLAGREAAVREWFERALQPTA